MTEHTVTLSAEAFAVVCGLVDGTIDHEMIETSDSVWNELSAAFPLEKFKRAVTDRRVRYMA